MTYSKLAYYQTMRGVLILVLGMVLNSSLAQIPVEGFAGHQRSTLDIMFFKFTKNSQGENNRWLFFNRNRAAIDYRITSMNHLPQFGFTEAFSYNHQKLKGWAPVIVGQILNSGVYAKAGVQYAKSKKNITLFSWLVFELKQQAALDYFLLFRYTPKLSEKTKLFIQIESVNSFPTNEKMLFNFTQRGRTGIHCRTFQIGAGLDFNQNGRGSFSQFSNLGIFIRNEF